MRLVKSAVFVFVQMVPVLTCSEVEAVDANEVKTLMDEGRYEEAQVQLEKGLLETRDHSQRYVWLAQIEAERGNPIQGFKHFTKALALYEVADANRETPLAEREAILDVVDQLRSRGMEQISRAILEGLRKKQPVDSSLLYEEANYYWLRDEWRFFFGTYFEAYKRNPSNRRGLACRALVQYLSNKNAPTVARFPLLTAAAANVDNKKLWQIVFSILKDHQLLGREDAISAFADTLTPPARNVFRAMYFQAVGQLERAVEEIEMVEPTAQSNRRMDLLRRRMLLWCGKEEMALTGLGEMPLAPQDSIAYSAFMLDSLTQRNWPEQDTLSCCQQLIQSLSSMAAPYCPDTQLQVNANMALSFLAKTIVLDGYPNQAASLLESQFECLNRANLSILEGLYLSGDKPDKAIHVEQRLLAGASPKQSEELLKTMLDNALLTDNSEAFGRALESVQKRYMTSLYKTYAGFQLNRSAEDHRILEVPGHFMRASSPSTLMFTSLGPCVKGCLFSMLRFWGDDLAYGDVDTSIDRLLSEEGKGDSLTLLQEWFVKQGFEVQFYAPCEEVILAWLSMEIPVLVIVDPSFVEDYQPVPGMYGAHVGVAYAYDNRSGKLFLKDSAGDGQMRLSYAEIPRMYYAAVVLRKNRSTAAPPTDCEDAKVSPTHVLTSSQIDQLLKRDERLKYWTCRHQVYVLNRMSDPNGIHWFEKCIEMEPRAPDVGLYECVVSMCIKHGQDQKAGQYIEKALAIDPNHLFSLDLKATHQLNSLKQGSVDLTAVKRLLDVAQLMEDINPYYPDTYWLRARIYAKAGAPGHLTMGALARFLRECNRADPAWRQKNAERINQGYKLLAKEREKWLAYFRIGQ